MLNENAECRICYENENPNDSLISPCKCKGTSKYIHKSCLSRWRNLNLDGDAYNKCMECNQAYNIRKLYNDELSNLFTDNFSKLYIGLYCLTFINTLSIWSIELTDNYLLIKTLNNNHKTLFHKQNLYNITSNNNTFVDHSLLSLIKYEGLSPLLFYFSFSMFLECLLFNIYFIIKTYLKIYRKKYYFNRIKKRYLLNVTYSLQFIIWYYLLVYKTPFFFLCFIFTMAIFGPYMITGLLKKHEVIILSMNKDNRGELIFPYEENTENLLENIVVY